MAASAEGGRHRLRRGPTPGSGWTGVGRRVAGSDRRFAPEDADRGQDDRLEDGPADQGEDRGDVEDRPAGLEVVHVQHAVERGHEDLARVQDERDQVVAFAGVQQEQDDPQDDQDLDDPEQQDHDSAGELSAGWGPGDTALDDGGAAVVDRSRLLFANDALDRKSTRLNSSHSSISYA